GTPLLAPPTARTMLLAPLWPYTTLFRSHPGLPFLLGLGPRRLEGRVEVNGRFPRHGDRLLSLWGQKSKSYRRRRRGAAACALYSASASRAAAWASPALWAAREAAARAEPSITPSPSRAFSPSRSWARIRHSAAALPCRARNAR